jgi:hypothetical protein
VENRMRFTQYPFHAIADLPAWVLDPVAGREETEPNLLRLTSSTASGRTW